MSDDSSNTIASTRRAAPGWSVAFIALGATIVLFFLAQFCAGMLVSLYAALQHWSAAQTDVWLTSTVAAQFAYSLLADGLLVAGVGLCIRWLGWNWASIGLKKPAAGHLLLGVVAILPYGALYLAIVILVSILVPSFDINQQQQIGFDSVHGTVPLLLTFLSLVVVPPLAEEITMRGFLYTGLKKWLPAAAAGLVVSLLFASAHLAEGGAAGPLWIGAIDTFSLSLVLVLLREKTGNLWAGIVLHATKNLVAFVVLFIIGGR